jgi:signal transduction histidine kinase
MRREPRRIESQEKFFRLLSSGLHDMAQPLSIAQGSLELALLAPPTVEQYRDLAKEVLELVGRIAESMRFASQLTRFQQPASDVADVLLNPVLEEAIADQRQAWDAAQVMVMYFRPRAEYTLRVSPSRLRQMLFHVLQVTQKLSRPGSAVHIKLLGSASKLRLKIQHPSPGQDPALDQWSDNDSVGRALALIDSIVSGAGGRFSSKPSPLLIVADFPLKHAGRPKLSVKGQTRRSTGRNVAGDSH